MHALWLQPRNPFGIIELVWKQDPTLQHFLIRRRTGALLAIPRVPVFSSTWDRSGRGASCIASTSNVFFLFFFHDTSCSQEFSSVSGNACGQESPVSNKWSVFIKPRTTTCWYIYIYTHTQTAALRNYWENSLKSDTYFPDVVKICDFWRQASVYTQELLVHKGSQGKTVEGVHTCVIHPLWILNSTCHGGGEQGREGRTCQVKQHRSHTLR